MAIQDDLYDILVDMGGASEHDRAEFLQHFPEPEFRFQGHFGFGGKIYYQNYGFRPFVVGYYKEDRTPELDELEKKINEKILALWVDSGRPVPLD